MARRRLLIEPLMLVWWSPHLGVSVAEDVIEDVVLGKQIMICANVVLVPGIVEWCQVIFHYSPFGGDLRPMKVIGGQSKYSGELCHAQFKPMAFNTEVWSLLIPIATSLSGGTKLSD
jgi:hypothetical protein